MNPEFSLRRFVESLIGLTLLSGAAFLAEYGDPRHDPHILVGGIGGLALMIHAAIGNFAAKPALVRSKPTANKLDRVLLHWDAENVFTVRDLLNGLAIFGRTGSGKTSSSGKALARAIVGLPGSGGLIIAAKPGEDRAMWEDIFTKAGRRDDLLIFAPDQPLRFNFLAYEMNQGGGHTRNITKTLMTIGESLRSDDKGGREDGSYWQAQEERLLYNSIEMVKLAMGPFTAPDLQNFIATAASSPHDFHDDAWLGGFHNQVLRAAYESPKTPMEQHDYELARSFFESEWPAMADRTKSSILAGTMSLLHTSNTGLTRELLSTSTNVSPDDLFAGRWILVDLAPSEMGDIGRFVGGCWKYVVQRAVLRRIAGPDANPVILFLDEAQGAVTSFDAHYLAQCRSHLGSAVYLSQSLPGYYAALGGEKGKHTVDALLAGLTTRIFHVLADLETAEWASGLVGVSLQNFMSGSMQTPDSPFGELMGGSNFSSGFNSQNQPTLQANSFMHGLRTGGPENDFQCDCYVIRSGIPFANGLNWIRTSFDQRS